MSFGQPNKITATVGVGREGIVDLQREARMSGPIHSKAVLTLTGFLNDRYAEMGGHGRIRIQGELDPFCRRVMEDLMRQVARHGGVLAVHGEDD
jgi:hypothetical protein